MPEHAMNPHLLLVEDDPVSQAFLSEAARSLPADVSCAATAEQACQLARNHHFDAWLIDAHLPDGSGIELLARLRKAHGSATPALLHTASQAPEKLAELKTAGFNAVIVKPLPAGAWRNALGRLLNLDPQSRATTPDDWDDASALRALNGNQQALETLRNLFYKELPQQYRKIMDALDAGDSDTALAELHRMKASCAFVGACALQQAVIALRATPANPAARQTFALAAEKMLATSPLG
ncbi:response regulator [Lysobacteraceae bacterium NML07-0707]|nr:response regulator [Xanthomonadaceae bacterium NML07-0707]